MLKEVVTIDSLDALDAFAGRLSKALQPGDGVALVGDLGAGKTTLVRMILRHLGYEDPVVSPTYPILVEYELPQLLVIHVDAYRLGPHQTLPFDPREWKTQNALVFVEWPENLNLSSFLLNHRISIAFSGDGVRTLRHEIGQ